VSDAILVCRDKTPIRSAARTMIKTHYHRLIVIEGKHPEVFPLGIISSFDIVAEMAKPNSIWQV
jgi:CBS domain-containing protein